MSLHTTMHPEPKTVRLAQAGSDPAREELAGYCRRIAFIFALQACGNPSDAHDLAQEAVFRFFKALDRFRADRPVRPWLMQITRNLIRDRARRARVRRVEPLYGDSDELIREPQDPQPNPETTAHRWQQRRMAWQAIGLLSEKDREILTLRDYLDLTYDEIAATLEIPRGTVMSRLHRARKRLRDKYFQLTNVRKGGRHD